MYGEKSHCVDHGARWTVTHCDTTHDIDHWGSGCYEVNAHDTGSDFYKVNVLDFGAVAAMK